MQEEARPSLAGEEEVTVGLGKRFMQKVTMRVLNLHQQRSVGQNGAEGYSVKTLLTALLTRTSASCAMSGWSLWKARYSPTTITLAFTSGTRQA